MSNTAHYNEKRLPNDAQPNPTDELRERLDRILTELFYTGSGQPTGNGIGIGIGEATDQIMQAIHAHMQAILRDVIGEDTKFTKEEADGKCEDLSTNINAYMKEAKNSLRNQQRHRAAKWLPKEER